MARQVQGPWFRASKGAWYATVEGKSVSLGVKGLDNEPDALMAWHRLMADGPKPKPIVKAEAPSVKELAEAYMADTQTRVKPSTMRLYRLHLGAFCKSLGSVKADALTTQHVARWLHALPHGSTTKAMMLRAVSACLGWGVANNMTPTNPAKQVPKPKSKSRSADTLISETDHAKMLKHASDAFEPVLTILHATGCRPGEACRISAETFNVKSRVVILADHKADRTGRPRLIFLPPKCVNMLKPLAAKFLDGPLLRTENGNPWNAQSINLALRKLSKRVGVKAMPYGYRHTFATNALANGVPDSAVAALLGHTSTMMVHRHYSHLTSQSRAMHDALAKVRK